MPPQDRITYWFTLILELLAELVPACIEFLFY